MKRIIIPETHEYGWKLLEGQKERVFQPTIKCVWKRIEYIVGQMGGKLIKTTNGFTIEGVDNIESGHAEMLNAETERFKRLKDGEYDVLINEETGREEPNLEED